MSRHLLLVHHTYSFEILRPLQAAARTRGDAVAWFLNRVSRDYLEPGERLLETVDQVRDFAPTAVYVPGNWVPGFFPGVKVQVFHGLANDRTGKKGHYRIRELFDLYCTHSAETTSQFEALAEKHGTFRVAETGWPKLDPLFRNGPDAVPDLRGTLDPSRPTVLYASTFSPSLSSSARLASTVHALSQAGRFNWLVTLHPKTDAAVIERYREMQGPGLRYEDSGRGVLPLLKSADVMLCDTSSISLEFMLLDRPVVTFRTKAPGPYVLDVSEPEQIESALVRALERPADLMAASRAYVDALHPYRDGRSSERVLDAMERFVAEGVPLRPKPINLWRRMQIRKRMGYYRLH